MLRAPLCGQQCHYQVADLIQQIVDLGAVGQADVRFAQQSSDLLPDLRLVDPHHHHERGDVVQHVGQEFILVVLQSLPLHVSQGHIPVNGGK